MHASHMLRVEHGRRYVSRIGNVRHITEIVTSDNPELFNQGYRFIDSRGKAYFSNGRCFDLYHEYPDDLVAMYAMRLKVGSHYRNALGQVVKIISKASNKFDNDGYMFEDDHGQLYTEDGKYDRHRDTCTHNLVEEVMIVPVGDDRTINPLAELKTIHDQPQTKARIVLDVMIGWNQDGKHTKDSMIRELLTNSWISKIIF